MNILKLIDKDDIRLKTATRPVGFPLTNEDYKDVSDLTATMYHEKGIGLAANQCGIDKQIIIIDVHYVEGDKPNPLVLINPRITYKSKEMIDSPEGCLSLPGVNKIVKRHKEVEITYMNLDMKEMQVFAGNNLLARCLQHEMDHISGKLITDE